MRLLNVWRNWWHRDRLERDLDDELRATVDALAAEHETRGMRPDAARRAALLEVGGIESVKQQVREARAGSRLETTFQDLRYAARLLRRNPLFTLTAVISLAVGIGATTSIFTVANSVLLRAAPGVTDPGRLVDIVRTERQSGFEPGVDEISYPDYRDVRRRLTTLEQVYGYDLLLRQLSLAVDDGGAERVFATFVTSNYFSALGVPAWPGRAIAPSDGDAVGGAPIVVLSHRYWDRRFNRDREVIGRQVRLNGHRFTVVGVARDGFHGTTVAAPDLWVPVAMSPVLRPDTAAGFEVREAGWLMLGGRLKRGVSRAQASQEVQAIGAALAREFPRDPNSPYGPPGQEKLIYDWSVERASPIPYGLRIIAAGALTLLMALVSTVLVIACANVAGVLLARATARRREIAVRTAIGAGRRRIMRQLLTESALLFVLSGAAGLALSVVLTMILKSLLPVFSVPVEVSAAVDARVAAFSLLLSLAASLGAGLAPALQASKADIVIALKDETQGSPDRLRLRSAFVVMQVAFSVLLVAMAGLFTRGFERVTTLDRGFDPVGIDVASVDLSMAGYTAATGLPVARDLLNQARKVPGVQTAGLGDRAPGAGGMSLGEVTIPGVVPPDGQSAFRMNWTVVDGDYFATLRIPLVAGREFSASDLPNSEGVAIVGEYAAQQFWPGQSALGRFVVVTTRPNRSRQLTVVGVAKDVIWRNGARRLNLFVPVQQQYVPTLTLFVRGDGRGSLGDELRRFINNRFSDLPVLAAGPIDTVGGPPEILMGMAGSVAAAVGFIGVLLAAMGIHGVVAYVTAMRTREIGVRLALGARRAVVVQLVLRQGMSLVLIGLAIGLTAAAAAARAFSSQRLGGLTLDVAVYGAVIALFVLVGLGACYSPVRRASRLGAVEALRYE